jgi:phage terminase small subunit
MAAPVNDNGWTGLQDPIVRAALRHFGEHGLHAAPDARRQAEETFLSGDSEASRRWLKICSMLGGRPVASRACAPVPVC